MRDLIINVGLVEEWQTINNTNDLINLFDKAKSTIVNGAKVELVRKTDGRSQKFDEIDTLEQLENYRAQVFKYLRPMSP
jgi:hypothetical protein